VDIGDKNKENVMNIFNQKAEGTAVGTYLKDQKYHFVLFRGQIIQ
jgi:hypothetical protein